MARSRLLRICLPIVCCSVLGDVIGAYDPHAELRAIVLGDARGVVKRLSAKLEDPAILRDTIIWARTLEMLGEQYYRISDIDEAKQYWDRALELRIAAFGEHSAQAGVGYAWQARYHSYMAAPQWDHQVTAERTALRAVELIAKERGALPVERILALRERAYAYKVFHGNHSNQRNAQSPADPPAAARPLFRKALTVAIATKDDIWTAQILHDIGNTFTDQAIPSRGDTAKLGSIVDSALWYYGRSIDLMLRNGLGDSQPVMMDHLTIGLVYEYAFENAGYMTAIQSYRKALRVLFNMQKVPQSTSLYDFDPRIPNKAQVLEIMSFISHSYDRMWLNDKQTSYIDSAILVIEAAVPYWEALIKEYDSRKIHLVTSSYAHSPFEYAQIFHIDRYLHKRDEDDLLKAIIHVERSRNVRIQRERLLRGLPALELLEQPMTMQDLVAPKGTLIIEYINGHGLTAVVMDENGPELIELGPTPFNAGFGVGRFAEFPVNEVSSDRELFREKALEWYHRLLRDALEGRDEKKLVIIPFTTLAHLPFGALLIDKARGKDRYVAQEYEIRTAPDLRSALQAVRNVEREASITIANGSDRSELPFALKYARSLADRFGVRLDTALHSEKLDDLLRRSGILHIASHADAEGMPDTEPYILLNDGRWNENDIPWGKVDRDLIVLASCASGTGRVFTGEGAQSLGHGLLQAGADAVVHTLWPVDDRATNEILHHMYSAMLDGGTASRALHLAKKKFIEEHRHDGLDDPFYWSGIVLAGTDVQIRKERSGLLIVVALGIAVLIGVFAYKWLKSSRARSLN